MQGASRIPPRCLCSCTCISRPRCGDVLDVGCGDGLLARKLAVRAKRGTGIDKSPEMIACARDHPGPSECQVIGGGVRADRVVRDGARARWHRPLDSGHMKSCLTPARC
ncbi:class I SAM-dependent methyltransferase [Streptomyces sp. NPDC088358]|uniref:class I SAM-dependent methyltransferase n=1 Tax=Streptomyces sp. NPDC088358 TaxID=3365857 RepID=UPI00382CFBB9